MGLVVNRSTDTLASSVVVLDPPPTLEEEPPDDDDVVAPRQPEHVAAHEIGVAGRVVEDPAPAAERAVRREGGSVVGAGARHHEQWALAVGDGRDLAAGVTPDHVVEYPLPYANGYDEILEFGKDRLVID